MFVIVALVVLGVIFAVGALLGISVSQSAAGNRARRQQRDRYLSALRRDALAGRS